MISLSQMNKQGAKDMKELSPGREFALELDAQDALASRRELFYIREGQIYMAGNSLGLCSKPAERANIITKAAYWITFQLLATSIS